MTGDRGARAAGLPVAERVERLVAREAARLEEASPRSAALFARARRSLAGGVASDHQRRAPWPILLASGEGATVTDVDGVRRVDLHNGFGAAVHGHAHPAITHTIAERARRATHVGVPNEDTVAVAEDLARRWHLPLWRFANSGSEAVTTAVRLARAVTGRDLVITTRGAYHGHADLGPSTTVPFDDASALAAALDARPAAAVLLEPAFLAGTVLPGPGYLEDVGAVTRERGALLIFDEVKTGLSVGPAGASGRWRVWPDLVAIGKALGGGLPAAAIGGTTAAMAPLLDGRASHAGTFNGNALCMAAARTTLHEVLTPDAFARLDALGVRMATEAAAILGAYELAGTTGAAGARGFAAVDDGLGELLWLMAANRGVLLTPARPQQWTLSVAHGDTEATAWLEVLYAFVSAVSKGDSTLPPKSRTSRTLS